MVKGLDHSNRAGVTIVFKLNGGITGLDIAIAIDPIIGPGFHGSTSVFAGVIAGVGWITDHSRRGLLGDDGDSLCCRSKPLQIQGAKDLLANEESVLSILLAFSL
jgi:hypothetical protein